MKVIYYQVGCEIVPIILNGTTKFVLGREPSGDWSVQVSYETESAHTWIKITNGQTKAQAESELARISERLAQMGMML